MAYTKRIKESIREAEFKRLISFTKGDEDIKPFTRDRFLRIYTLLYYTGMRINEISQLRVSHLKEILSTGEVKIITHKQKMERKLFFSEKALKDIKKLFKNDLKLIRKQNRLYASLSPTNLIETVNKHIQKALGDTAYTSHSFRQGIITEYASKGVSTRIIQEFIGHNDTKTTLRYIRPSESDIRSSLVR